MKRPNDDVYAYADEVIERLRQLANAEFGNAGLAPFDELNVIRVRADATEMYKWMEAVAEREFIEVAKQAYAAAVALAMQEGYEKGVRSKTAKGIVLGLLAGYNAVTKYQYRNEMTRKRDRLIESVVASGTRLAVREAYATGARYWFGQARQYTDMTVDEARETGFRDSGVRKVMWVTQRDGKVCHECLERDGHIYRVGHVPPKPHPRCRCYIVPAPRESQG